MDKIYTAGYSSFEDINSFITAVKQEGIDIVVDVRSNPYSRVFQDFNVNKLRATVEDNGLMYVYMGDKLGGAIVKKEVLKGITHVSDILENKDFRYGMRQLFKLSRNYTTLILCAERLPTECHRFLAIGFLFKEKAGFQVVNFVGDKTVLFEDILKFEMEKLKAIHFNEEALIKQYLYRIYRNEKAEVNYEDIHNRLF